MTRFVPGTKGLSDQVCSGYQGIECQGLFRVLRVWVLRFVPGKKGLSVKVCSGYLEFGCSGCFRVPIFG